MFGKTTFSSVYLVGEEFDKSWMGNSLAFSATGGRFLWVRTFIPKGACYAAMNMPA